MEGKWFGQNESIRVPTMIYDGRSSQDRNNNDQMVLDIDLAPTILDYAGIRVPVTMQGAKPSAVGGRKNAVLAQGVLLRTSV